MTHADRDQGEGIMFYRGTFEALASAALLLVATAGAQAEEKKYPNW